MHATKPTSTRDQILFILKTQGPLSASEITEQMQITNMAVRRHLQTLESQGLIVAHTVRQQMGRPTARYELTGAGENVFPKKYDVLISDLLTELMHVGGPDIVEQLFWRRKQKMQLAYREHVQGESLEEKVKILAKIQNDNGYMANWRKNEQMSSSDSVGEFTITEHHCPIKHIAKSYDYACQCEQALFESLLEVPVERTTCIAKGDRMCTYQINTK